ncbi:MAG: hypothetical protein U0074_05570 [Kouleothrix sp.]
MWININYIFVGGNPRAGLPGAGARAGRAHAGAGDDQNDIYEDITIDTGIAHLGRANVRLVGGDALLIWQFVYRA